MAQISFCQQQLVHFYDSITPACLSSATQAFHTSVKKTAKFFLNREGIISEIILHFH